MEVSCQKEKEKDYNMGQTREEKVIKQLSGKPTIEKRTPIATDMFLPNHSGVHQNLNVDELNIIDSSLKGRLSWDKTSFMIPVLRLYTNLGENTDTGLYIESLNGVTCSTTFSGSYFTSDVATGTSPYQSNSTTINLNLNADLLDGNHAGGTGIGITGEVRIWAGTVATVPTGWLLCNGAAISRTTYAALFTAIGTTHGAGNGTTTFNIPDIRDKFIVGAGNTYNPAAAGGAATHNHTQDAHSHTFTSATGSEEADISVTDVGHTHGCGAEITSTADFEFQFGTGGPAAIAVSGTNSTNNTTGISVVDNGHSHTVPTSDNATATNQAGSSLPPYYALTYMIKT